MENTLLEGQKVIITNLFYEPKVGDIVVVGVDGEEFCDCPIDFKTWKWLLAEWGN